MSVDELLDVLHRTAGLTESVIDESVLDAEFEDLGCDSLALLEITGLIKREFRVTLADDALGPHDSPRRLLALVNGARAGYR